MLVKLLKYDLKYMLKNMSAFYILSIFFAILTRILFNIEEQSTIVKILGQISVGFMFSMTASALVNTVLRSWIRFKDSLYKDESYLTHTLPVTKRKIFDSKFFQTLIFFIVGFVVVLTSLFIAYYSKENWTMLTNFIKTIVTGLNMNASFLIFMIIFMIFLEFFNAIQCGFLGIILGFRQNKGKVGFSVLFGFVAYFIAQTIILSLTFLYGFYDESVMNLFKTGTVVIDVSAYKTIMIIGAIAYIIIIYLMRLLCIKILNKGVNVE